MHSKQFFSILGFWLHGLACLHGQNAPGANSGQQLFEGNVSKIFGKNTAFTATLHDQIGTADGFTVMVGKVAYDNGKTAYEVDLSKWVTGGPHGDSTAFSADEKAQLNASGMNLMDTISRPDKKLVYVVTPVLKAYVELPYSFKPVSPDSDLKIETLVLGQEKVGRYDCVKSKITFISKSGPPEVFTVWSANTLKNFPAQIAYILDARHAITLTFEDVKLEKPNSALFDPPIDAKKFASSDAIMNELVTPRLNALEKSSSHPSQSSATSQNGTTIPAKPTQSP
jgi:hypothetical protein